jgi:predicted TIM-barrel fold metal-dependent hydrolase
VERSILSLATPMINYAAPAAAAIDGARLVNDEFARLKAARPGRFDAWAYLPMQDPAEAAKELTRAVAQLGLRGGHVSSNVRGRYLDAPSFWLSSIPPRASTFRSSCIRRTLRS